MGKDGSSTGPGGLNESQRLFVLTHFSRIDELLQAIARISESISSPLSRYRYDLSADEASQLAAVAANAREKILAALHDLRVELPTPELSSKWTVQTSLTFIDVALSGMTEKALHGYGAVDPTSAERMSAAVADIRRLVEDARHTVKG